MGNTHVTNILFSTPLVPEIIAGRKTETRRLKGDTVWPLAQRRLAAGDEVWLRVRETFTEVHPIQAQGRPSMPGQAGIPGPPRVQYRVIWRADGEMPPPLRHIREWPYREFDPCAKKYAPGEGGKWAPAIHMPAWASRLYLPVTEVRREQLAGVTDEGALAEGVLEVGTFGDRQAYRHRPDLGGDLCPWRFDARDAFLDGFREFAGLMPDADPGLWVIAWDPARVRSADPREGGR